MFFYRMLSLTTGKYKPCQHSFFRLCPFWNQINQMRLKMWLNVISNQVKAVQRKSLSENTVNVLIQVSLFICHRDFFVLLSIESKASKSACKEPACLLPFKGIKTHIKRTHKRLVLRSTFIFIILIWVVHVGLFFLCSHVLSCVYCLNFFWNLISSKTIIHTWK